VDDDRRQSARFGHDAAMEWADLAARQDGIITRVQLRRCAVGDNAIDRLLSSGALTVLERGVFLVRGAPMTYRASLWRAVAASGGVLAFGTAAHLWGVIDAQPDLVHVHTPPQRRPARLAGVKIHRCFVPIQAMTTCAGLPITPRSWSVLDHLGTLRPGPAQTLADRCLQRGWITANDIRRRLSELPGHGGNAILRGLAQQLGDGAAAHSERVLHRILVRAGLTGWTANYPVWHDGDLLAVVDVALVESRIALEVDGWAHHSDVERFQRDRTRQNALAAAGWTILRFTWADLTQRPGYVASVIRRQLAA
jgi:very-short-patch-repair endonuclease